MAAALVLSRQLRARVAAELDAAVAWEEVRQSGTLPPDLLLPCIELFRRGACGELDAIYERGRILVAARGALARLRVLLSKIPGHVDIAEIRLDGDWVLWRLQPGNDPGGAAARTRGRFLKAHARRFPTALTVGGVSYRCSYGFADAADFTGVDLLGAAIEDVQTWFDSLGQVLQPVYQPGEDDLQEVLVISPLGMRNDDDPWCWSSLADRLIPFLLADYSPMTAVAPELVAGVESLVQRFRAGPWMLPMTPRRFRALQRKLHWSCESKFVDVLPLLSVISECEVLMGRFAEEFEPLIWAHADTMLDAMETYCAPARDRLWARLHEDRGLDD